MGKEKSSFEEKICTDLLILPHFIYKDDRTYYEIAVYGCQDKASIIIIGTMESYYVGDISTRNFCLMQNTIVCSPTGYKLHE